MDPSNAKLTHWLARLAQKPMPIWLSQAQIDAAASEGNARLAQLIDHDPLLAIRIFHQCRYLKDSASPKSIHEAVEAFGAGQIRTLTQDLPRLNPGNAAHQHLLQSLGDALLATSLLRAWFELKSIPWNEEDYWLSVMDASAIWAVWWLEPQMMEGFEFQLETQGRPVHKSIADHLECRYLQAITGLMHLWRLPIALNLGQQSDQPSQELYKRQALKFFLRFAHELSQASRFDWQSKTFQQLCRRGAMALGIDDFEQQLINWMSSAAKQHPQMPWVSTALTLRQQGQQPNWLSTERYQKFEQLQRQASKTEPTPLATAVTAVTTAATPTVPTVLTMPTTDPTPSAPPLTVAAKPVTDQETASFVNATQPLHQQAMAPAPRPPPAPFSPKQVYTDVKQAMLRQHSPYNTQLDLEYSLLQAGVQGLMLDAIVLWRKAHNDPWFELVSWRGQLDLHNKLPLHGSTVLQQFCLQPVSLWISDLNREPVMSQFPSNFRLLLASRQHYLRGIQTPQGNFLLQGISHLSNPEHLAQQYQLFRELASAFGKACLPLKK